MRAVFCEIDTETEETLVVISGERAHHLHVVRVKVGEELLLLNGFGKKFHSEIISITKKEIILKIIKIDSTKPTGVLDLAVATPKKEAFEDILKISVELGLSRIIPLFSDYSQYDFIPNERSARVLESAMVQSNNQYLPEILKQTELSGFLESTTGQIIYFTAEQTAKEELIDFCKRVTILIGPEAGFSIAEEAQIKASANVIAIHLQTPILRAPTAVATAVGYVLGKGHKTPVIS
jgi:16S rRNA (uracil1498-N3)-methyltransferase